MQCLLCKKTIPDNTNICPYCELPNFMFMYPNLIDVNDSEKERINGIIKRYNNKSSKSSDTDIDLKRQTPSSDANKNSRVHKGNSGNTKSGNTVRGYTQTYDNKYQRNTNVKSDNNMFPAFIVVGAIAFFAGLVMPDDTGLLLLLAGMLTAIFGLLGRKVCSFLGITGYIMITIGLLGEMFSSDLILSGDFSMLLLFGIIVMVIGLIKKSRKK